MNKCAWCGEEIEEDETLCNLCSIEAMDDIELGEYNHAFDDED